MSALVKDVKGDWSCYIRDITEEEIETFWNQGWLFAPRMVAPELVAELLNHAKDWAGVDYEEWPSDAAEQASIAEKTLTRQHNPHQRARHRDPWMFNYITQRQLGKASARLLKVPAVRVYSETLHLKPPIEGGGDTALGWHQDFPHLPIDRTEAVQTWMALAPITPEMGPMVHLTGSHREPPMGSHISAGEDPQALYPEIFARYPVSEPQSYQPGDVMFHHCLTYHSSGANRTSKVRWAMSSYRISTRSLYTAGDDPHSAGFGLQPWKPLDHPHFPQVYP